MTSNRRVFYVAYSSDTRRQHVLDAIRFIADPSEKTRAHVTLRGPYLKKQTVPAVSKVVDGSEIIVTGVDAFLRPGQNTVFFAIAAPDLKPVCRKPDYPDYRPHLTIYDGKSRSFAVSLCSRLQEIDPTFRFRATPLAALATNKGQSSFELRAAYDEELVKQVTGRRIPADDVAELSADERINLIARLCSELVERTDRPTGWSSSDRAP